MTKLTILLVEDNPDDELLTMRELKQQNLANHITVARDGVEALDYIFGQGAYSSRDPSDTPALVILDLKLPKVDGLEVLRRIRADERTRMMPVVILTSSDDQGDLVKSYNLGVNSYVRKPVNFDDFKKAVRELHLYWLLINEPPPRT